MINTNLPYFPYSNFHQLNLDWVISEMKRVIQEWANTEQIYDDITKQFDELKNYVTNLFNADLQDEVNQIMDKWLADGTLDNIIGNHLRTAIINMVSMGCDNTGNKDCSDAIEAAISAVTGNIMYFPPGTYLISRPIIMPGGVGETFSIQLDNAKIKAIAAMDYMIDVGANEPSDTIWFGRYSINGIGMLDLNLQAKCGIHSSQRTRFVTIRDINIFYIPDGGVGLKMGDSVGTSHTAQVCTIDNLFIYNINATNCKGVQTFYTDNYFTNIQIQNCDVSMELSGGWNFVHNMHVYNRRPLNEQNDTSYGLNINSPFNLISNYYADNCRMGIRSVYGASINGYNYFIPSNPAAQCECYAVSTIIGIKHNITGFNTNAGERNNVTFLVYRIANMTDEFQVGAKHELDISTVIETNKGCQVYGDEAFNLRNSKFTNTIFKYANHQLLTGYYLIGFLSESSGTGVLSLGLNNDVMCDITFNTVRQPFALTHSIQYFKNNTSSNYGFAISNTVYNWINKRYRAVYLKINAAVNPIETNIDFKGYGESNFYLCSYRLPEDATRYLDSDLDLLLNVDFSK